MRRGTERYSFHRQHGYPPRTVCLIASFIGSVIVYYLILHSRIVKASPKLHDSSSLSFFQNSPTAIIMSPRHQRPVQLIVVAPTHYTSLEETRYLLGVDACRNAAQHQIRLILVDASPLDEVRLGLQAAGQDGSGRSYVRVIPQTAKGRKGTALREAIQFAHQEAEAMASSGATPTIPTVIGFQELEKVDMFRHWLPLYEHMVETAADATALRRADESFRKYYPIEQYHCESFANLYLDSIGAAIGLPSIDWTSGPMAFRHSFAKHWMDFEGELWDAQLVPLVRAHLAGAKVTSFEVDYHHPTTMKVEEEGVAKWNEKRLFQLNFLKDTVGKEMAYNTPAKPSL